MKMNWKLVDKLVDETAQNLYKRSIVYVAEPGDVLAVGIMAGYKYAQLEAKQKLDALKKKGLTHA